MNCHVLPRPVNAIAERKEHQMEQQWEKLAESEHYYMIARYSEAVVYFKGTNRLAACVGDFGIDPQAGFFDAEEKYCVTIGNGIIKYFLHEPFEEYSRSKTSKQWIETGRTPDGDWFDRFEEITPAYIVVSWRGEKKSMRKFDLGTLEEIKD